MYTSFQVKNYRCFRDLRINDLSRINLIAGKNNVGKTALLEALYIHCSPAPSSFKKYSFTMLAEIYGRMVLNNQESMVLKFLQILEPRLKRLEMVVQANEPILYGDIGINKLVPLPLMGEGMSNLLKCLLDIKIATGGVALIDEIENGLHHSVMVNVWKAIGMAARQFNTQIFATTHNMECIRAAHEAFSESNSGDFRLHRLEKVNGDIQAKTLNHKIMESAIEMNLEVR